MCPGHPHLDLLHGERGVLGSLFQKRAHNLQFLLHLGHVLGSAQQLGVYNTNSWTYRGLGRGS